MDLSFQQLTDIKVAVKYYMTHHVSVNNPRYKDYKVILQLLENNKDE